MLLPGSPVGEAESPRKPRSRSGKTRDVKIPADVPALVVFGRGEAELSTKAAELMGMRTLTVRIEAEQALAAKLSRGRVFAACHVVWGAN